MITETCLYNSVDVGCDKCVNINNNSSSKDIMENSTETESRQGEIEEEHKLCKVELAKEVDKHSLETEDKGVNDHNVQELTSNETSKTSTLQKCFSDYCECSSKEEQAQEHQEEEEEQEKHNCVVSSEGSRLPIHKCNLSALNTTTEKTAIKDNEHNNTHQLCSSTTVELTDEIEQVTNLTPQACDTHNAECQLKECTQDKSIHSNITKSIVCKGTVKPETNDNNNNVTINNKNENNDLHNSNVGKTAKSAETIADTTTTSNVSSNINNECHREQEEEIIQKGIVQKHAKKPFSIAEWFERRGVKEPVKPEEPSTKIELSKDSIEQNITFNTNVYNNICNVQEMIDARKKMLPLKNNAEATVNIAEIVKLQYEQHRRNAALRTSNVSINNQSSDDNNKRQSVDKIAVSINVSNKVTEDNTTSKRMSKKNSHEHEGRKSWSKCELEEEEEYQEREKLLELENNKTTDILAETQDQHNNETKTIIDSVSNGSTDDRLEIQQTVVVKHIKPTIDIERLRALRNRVLPGASSTTSTLHSAISSKEVPSFAQKAKVIPTSSTSNTNSTNKTQKEKNSKHADTKIYQCHSNHTTVEKVSQNERKLHDKTSNNSNSNNKISSNTSINAETHLNDKKSNKEQSEREENKNSTYMLGDEMYTTVPTHMSSAEENEVFEEISKLLLRYCLGRDEKRHTTTIPLPAWSVLPPGLAINSQKPNTLAQNNNNTVTNQQQEYREQQEKHQEKLLEKQHTHVEPELHSSEEESQKDTTETKKPTMSRAEWPTLEEAIKQAKKHKERERTIHKKNKTTNETTSCNNSNAIQHKAAKEIDKEDILQGAKNDKDSGEKNSNTNSKNIKDVKETLIQQTDNTLMNEVSVIGESKCNNDSNSQKNIGNNNDSSSCENVVIISKSQERQPTESSTEEHKYVCDNYGGGGDDENSLNKELELYFHLVRLYQTKKVTLRTLELVHEMLKHTRVLPHVPTMNNFSSRPITTHDPISRRRAYLQQVIISLLDEMKQEKLREERNDADDGKKISLIDFDSQIKNIIKGIPVSGTKSSTSTKEVPTSHSTTQMNFSFSNNINNSNINIMPPFNNFVPPLTLPVTSFQNNLITPFNVTVPNAFQPNCPSSSMPHPMPLSFPVNYNPFMMPNVHMPFVQPTFSCVMPHRTWPNMMPFAHPSPALPTTNLPSSSLPHQTNRSGIINAECSKESNENNKCNANSDNSITTIASHYNGQNSTITNIDSNSSNKSNGVEFSTCTTSSTQALNSNLVLNSDESKVTIANTNCITGADSTLEMKGAGLSKFGKEPHFAVGPYTMGNSPQVCMASQPTQSQSTSCISPHPVHTLNTTFFPPQNCSIMPLPFPATTPLTSTESQVLHQVQQSESLAGHFSTSQTMPAVPFNSHELTSTQSQLNANLQRFLTAPHRVINQPATNTTKSWENVTHLNENNYERAAHTNDCYNSNVNSVNSYNNSNSNCESDNDENDDVNRQLDEYVKAIMQYVQQSEEIVGEEDEYEIKIEHKDSTSNKEEDMYNILTHNDILDEEKSDNDNTELSTLCSDYHIAAPVTTTTTTVVNNNISIPVPTISKEEREVLQDVQRDFKRRMEKVHQAKEVNESDNCSIAAQEEEGNNVCSYEINNTNNENVDDSQLDYEIDYSNMFLHVCSESASLPCSPERMLESNCLTGSHTKKHANENVKGCDVENPSTHRMLFKANTESDEDEEKNDICINRDKSKSSNSEENDKCDECTESVSKEVHAKLNEMSESKNDEHDVIKLQIMTEIDTMNSTRKTHSDTYTNNEVNNTKEEVEITKDKEYSNDDDDDDDDDKSDNDSFDANLIEEDKVIGLEVDLLEEHEQSFEEEHYCEEKEEEYYEEEQTLNNVNYNELGKVGMFDMETAPHSLIDNEQINSNQMITSENVSKLQEYINNFQEEGQNDQLRLSPHHDDDDDVSVTFDNNLPFTFDQEWRHENAHTSDVMNTPAVTKMPHIKLDVGPKINNSREASSAKDMVAAALAQSADKFSVISSFSSSSLPAPTINATLRVSPSKEHIILTNRRDISPMTSSYTFANAQTSLFAAPSFNTTIFAAPEPRRMLHLPNEKNSRRGNNSTFTTANTNKAMPTNRQRSEKSASSNYPDSNSQLNTITTRRRSNNIGNDQKMKPTQSNVKSVLKPTAAPFIPFHMREKETTTTTSTSGNDIKNNNVSYDAEHGNGEMLTVTGFTNDEPQNMTTCAMPSERRNLHYRVTSNGNRSDSPYHGEYHYLPSQWATPEMFDVWKEMMQSKQFHSQDGPHKPFEMPHVHAYRNRRSFSQTPHNETCYPRSQYRYGNHNSNNNSHYNQYHYNYDHHDKLQEEDVFEDEEHEFHTQYNHNPFYGHGYNLANCSSRPYEPIDGFYESTEDDYGPFLDEAEYEANHNLLHERVPCQTITNMPQSHQFQSYAYNVKASSRYRHQPRFGHGQELTIPPPRSQTQRQHEQELNSKYTRDKPKIEVPLPHSAQRAREKERTEKMSKLQEEQQQVHDKDVEVGTEEKQ